MMTSQSVSRVQSQRLPVWCTCVSVRLGVSFFYTTRNESCECAQVPHKTRSTSCVRAIFLRQRFRLATVLLQLRPFRTSRRDPRISTTSARSETRKLVKEWEVSGQHHRRRSIVLRRQSSLHILVSKNKIEVTPMVRQTW